MGYGLQGVVVCLSRYLAIGITTTRIPEICSALGGMQSLGGTKFGIVGLEV